MRSPGRFLVATIVALATIGVIIGVLVTFMLTPLWVYGEQDRAGSASLTGYTDAEVRIATGAILHDLLIGPPAFDITVRDQPVLSEPERSHMRDVRTVFGPFFAVTGISLVALIVARWRTHGSILYWKGVRAGGSLLAVTVAAFAGFALVAFSLLFEVFHELLFSPGTYTFDPTRDRLVQLFPERFWFDTVIVLAIGLVLFGLATRTVAGRKIKAHQEAAAEARSQTRATPPPAPVDGPPVDATPVDPTPIDPTPAGT